MEWPCAHLTISIGLIVSNITISLVFPNVPSGSEGGSFFPSTGDPINTGRREDEAETMFEDDNDTETFDIDDTYLPPQF